MKKIFVPLFFAVAVFARLPAQEAPDAPQGGGEERYYESGLGDGDFARSLRAAMRGEDYYNAQQYEAALEAFDEAIALMPDRMYAAWVGRGNLYFYVYKEYGKTRNIDRLNFTAAYIERGDLYRKQRQYGLALADYDEAVALGGANLPVAYHYRARADWEETLRFDPGNIGARNKLEALRKEAD